MAYTPTVYATAESPSTSTVTSVVFNASATTAAGDTLVVCIGNNGGTGATVTSVVDNAGNTYTQIDDFYTNSGNPCTALYYCASAAAVTASNTITIHWGAACNYAVVCVDLPGAVTKDVTNTAVANASTGSVTVPASGSLTKPYEVIIATAASQSGAAGMTWPTGSAPNLLATVQAQPAGSGGNTYCSAAYGLSTTTSALTATVTLGSGDYITIAGVTFELPKPIFPHNTLPSGTNGITYSSAYAEATVYAGSSPTYSITSGSLPTGITQNTSTGLISGTPSVTGSFPITVQCTDGNSNSTTQSYTLVINAGSSGGGGSGGANGESTPYLIGSNSAASGGSATLTVNVQTPVAAGNAIIVGCLIDVAAVTVSVSDTQFNGYSQIATDTTEATAQVAVWQCIGANALSTADSISVVYSATTSAQGVICVGDPYVLANDVATTGHGNSPTASVASGTLTQAQEHVIAFVVAQEGTGSTGSQVITSSGTFTTNSTTTSVTATVIGAGGGGGGSPVGSNYAGSGGGGGGCAFGEVTVSPSTQYTVTVGTGGTGGNSALGSSGWNATAGSGSSFQGLDGNGGGGGIGAGSSGVGAGGTASGGTSNRSGGNGGFSGPTANGTAPCYGGGGGGAGGGAATGSAGTQGTQSVQGTGGSGGGASSNGIAGGAGGIGGVEYGNGGSGSSPGAGGGGAGNTSGNAGNGGNGANGEVYLAWNTSTGGSNIPGFTYPSNLLVAVNAANATAIAAAWGLVDSTVSVTASANMATNPWSAAIITDEVIPTSGNGTMQTYTPAGGTFQALDNKGNAIGSPAYTLAAAKSQFVNYYRLQSIQKQK